MSEVEINGTLYRCGRLPTREQFRVVKRLAPSLHMLIPMFAGQLSVVEAITMLGNTINQLSDADADYALDAALACVAWRQGTMWQPLRVQGGAIMVGSADRLDVQLRLFGEVLMESLGDFSIGLLLPFLPSGSNGVDKEEEEAPQEQQAEAMVARPRAALNS